MPGCRRTHREPDDVDAARIYWMRAEELRDQSQRRVERCRSFGARERVACLYGIDGSARSEVRHDDERGEALSQFGPRPGPSEGTELCAIVVAHGARPVEYQNEGVPDAGRERGWREEAIGERDSAVTEGTCCEDVDRNGRGDGCGRPLRGGAVGWGQSHSLSCRVPGDAAR